VKIAGIVLLAAIVLAILTGACRVEFYAFKQEGTPGRSTASLPRYGQAASSEQATWKAEMSSACSDLTARIARLTAPKDRDGLVQHLRQIVALEHSFEARASSLEPPASLAAEAERALASRRDWKRALARLARAGASGKRNAALREATVAQSVAQRTTLLFGSLGLTECLLPRTGIPG
jgi:hypothetical protein